MPHAETARQITAFELHSPPPTAEWSRERGELQRLGILPDGAAQLRSWAMQRYLDDINIAALNDTVTIPHYLAHIAIGREATAQVGGTPAESTSRVAVYTRFIIATLQELDFAVSAPKTQCGDTIISLGIRIDIPNDRQNCPELKRAAVLDTMTRLRKTLQGDTDINLDDTEKLVGRLSALSAIFPGLISTLHGGYAVMIERKVRQRRQD